MTEELLYNHLLHQYQTESEKSRDIDDKAKYLATTSAIIIGLLINAIGYFEISPLLILIMTLLLMFLSLSIVIPIMAIFQTFFRSMEKEDDVANVVAFLDSVYMQNEKLVGDLMWDISSKHNKLSDLNAKKSRLLFLGYASFTLALFSMSAFSGLLSQTGHTSLYILIIVLWVIGSAVILSYLDKVYKKI
ncbi:hypothetical protein [Methanococcoides sp. LMO-2]|uniref:Uncharacterized protein n=1 Tax=Methanococcoides cohabitans TaxID=3136559 RepID=A0ABU9KX77_9EURY